jgi:hypothetical protein
MASRSQGKLSTHLPREVAMTSLFHRAPCDLERIDTGVHRSRAENAGRADVGPAFPQRRFA